MVGINYRVGSHTLRKTYGYHLRKRGIDTAVLQEIFGHANLRDLKRYLGISDAELMEVGKICI